MLFFQNMNKRSCLPWLLIAVVASASVSCINDLNTKVTDPDQLTAENVYKDANSYEAVLAKVYAGLALSGQQGPSGDSDISGIDEGFGQYLRGYWQLQELPTDEAVLGWSDAGLPELTFQTWSSSNQFIYAAYSRFIYQITLANQFIKECTDSKLSERGISGSDSETIKVYEAEARWLRALSYYHALDLFGSPPFVTEKDPIGAFTPQQINREDLFKYIESELLEIEPLMMAPRTNPYGRVDRVAAWALLSRLYLNAKVYTGEEKYTECISYSQKAIEQGGYSLTSTYANLFLADNNSNGAQTEIIFAIPYDGERSRTYGGTTFIVNAQVNTNNRTLVGITGGWAGLRITGNLYDLFSPGDTRAIFYTNGHTKDIPDFTRYTDGYASLKFKNLNADGSQGISSPDGTFVSCDFPLFRLAEVYLNYAEALVRGGQGGDASKALQYINELRQRAYGNTSGNIYSVNLLSADNYKLILEERARELYLEAIRRTDLVRFGLFTGGTYLWPWKGGVKDGISTQEHFNLYPIPSNDLTSNPNLKQNPNY